MPREPLAAPEVVRQGIHIAAGLWAFLLPWTGWLPLFGLATVALAFNLWLLPRIGGRWLWRSAEIDSGRAPGFLLYPFTVAVLLVVFQHRPEVAAAGWGLLAFADGSATLVGRGLGASPLPWNSTKSWEGSIVFFLVGWAALWGLVSWTTPGRYQPAFLLVLTAVVALLASLLESLPQRLDDNVSVPLLASLTLLCGLETAPGWRVVLEPEFLRRLFEGGLICSLLAVVAWALATLDLAGAVAGAILGTMIFAGLSWPGFLVLAVFFVLSSGATRAAGFASPRRPGSEGGRRGARNAIANGGVAALCAVFAILTPHSQLFTLAFVCSLAAAAADTVESEIGSVWGRPTVLITSLREVAPGTDGGISPMGTLAGWLAAGLTAAVAALGELQAPALILPISLLAVGATLIESVAGATLESAGLLDNEGVNFLNTLLGALGGALLSLLVAS